MGSSCEVRVGGVHSLKVLQRVTAVHARLVSDMGDMGISVSTKLHAISHFMQAGECPSETWACDGIIRPFTQPQPDNPSEKREET